MIVPTSATLQVIVDLSNVAKDDLLGFSHNHASLARWDRLRRVWLRDHDEPVHFTLVADGSLRRALSRADQARLEQWVTSGEAVVVPDADIEVLRLAVEAGGVALSNDRYVDHRRIPGVQRARLVGWVVRGETTRLQERSLDRLLSAVISARALKQELKEVGLAEGAPELKYRWYCRDGGCARDLITVPAMVRGSATCAACGSYLERGAAWRHPIWIKILYGTHEVARFVLEDGEAAFIGSGAGADVISLANETATTADVMALDDRHIELRNELGRLRARDNASSRGSALRRPVAGQRNMHSPPMPLSTTAFATIGPGAKIVLGRTPFTVQVSGGTRPE